jgi:hypothetical protein
MIPSSIPVYWLGVISGFLLLALWQHFVKGRLMCLAVFIGHAWAVVKEEVCRPLRVIGRALNRAGVDLDEHEEEIS